MKFWHGALLFIVIGYALGFWFPSVGNMTLAKVYPRG